MQQNGTPAGDRELGDGQLGDGQLGDGQLIRALAGGATEREAAEQAGVDEPAVHRRMAEADFRRAVSEGRDRLFDAARGLLASLAGKAAGTLERLMESDRPSAALGAAKAVLELGPQLRESAEVEERMNCLEDLENAAIGGKQTPTGEEQALIRALAAGASTPEAAEQAGVDEPTVRRRLAEPDFRRAVSRARGRLFATALGRLASLAGKAAGVFARLMESDQPSAARGAAKAVLQLGPRLRESTELEERLTLLEKRADEWPDAEPKVVVIDPWYDGSGLETAEIES